MSSDDFGTINARRGERAREIEVMRQHYRQHRDALQRMAADAPTEFLASEYQRLVADIDRSLVKLEELEGKTPTTPAFVPPPAAQPDLQRRMTHPASRPLVHDPAPDAASIPPAEGVDEERSRLPLIIGVAVVALVLIGWLIWRASSNRSGTPTVVEQQPAAVASDSVEPGTSVADDTIAPAGTPPTVLAASPDTHDYGVVRKGTRATRQFEISNTSDEPISIVVARSACRCLFYEHAPVIPPKAKESLTVTVDGARAKVGELREQVKISSKADAAVSTVIDVNATIR